MKMDHEKLGVYQVSLDFASWIYLLCNTIKGVSKNSRVRVINASQEIVMHIAEGYGTVSSPERNRSLRMAMGSARECAAALDILTRYGVIAAEEGTKGKEILAWIVKTLTAMMTRPGKSARGARVSASVYVSEPPAKKSPRLVRTNTPRRRSSDLPAGQPVFRTR